VKVATPVAPRAARGGPIIGRGGGNGREILGACLPDEGAGNQKVLVCLLDVLVIDIELFFERVQFGILENLPPFAAQHALVRLGHLPALGFLEMGGRFLVGRSRRRRGRRMIFRADRATTQRQHQRGGGR
jgi:hypothetical protein